MTSAGRFTALFAVRNFINHIEFPALLGCETYWRCGWRSWVLLSLLFLDMVSYLALRLFFDSSFSTVHAC